MENAGSVALKIRREGDTQCKVQVHYYTEDKEAKAGEDYEAIKVFNPSSDFKKKCLMV